MIKTLNLDLLNYIDLHDNKSFKIGLFDEWYKANFINLARAVKKEKGLKLILDVETFSDFEFYCKKLFLFSDLLILRDAIRRDFNEALNVPILVCECWKEYPELEKIKDPLMLIPPPISGFWTSSFERLKNGKVVPLAFKWTTYFPSQVYEWFLGKGHEYISQENIVYAPFIPSLETEMDFFNKGFSISDSYNCMSLYSRSYEWLDVNTLKSFLLLEFPTLENVDIKTLNKIKQDDYDSYAMFRSEILNCIKEIKSCFGKPGFMNELRYIQRNRIDDNLDKIQAKMKRLRRMSSLRKLGLTVGVIGLDFACYGTVTGLTPILQTAVLGINEISERLRDKGELQENPCYFLWKLKNVK